MFCTTRTFRIESPAFVFLYLISLPFPAAEMQCLFLIINRELAEHNLAVGMVQESIINILFAKQTFTISHFTIGLLLIFLSRFLKTEQRS